LERLEFQVAGMSRYLRMSRVLRLDGLSEGERTGNSAAGKNDKKTSCEYYPLHYLPPFF
jgi:hypothetical protein